MGRLYLFLVGILLTSIFGCSAEDLEEILSINSAPTFVLAKPQYSLELGRQNAVKKAYQMTDLQFTPLNPIGQRNGTFESDVTYKGVMYSSAKELETFVGNDISIHTLMTAIHNPKSKIYTEDISLPPYHGKNCRAYYGAVCSSFVSHALGIETRYWANDFPLSELMQEVDNLDLDSLQIADVLWKDGHVAMITDIVRDERDSISKIEISECAGIGCKRYYQSRKQVVKLLSETYKKVFRYKELYKNIDYTPLPQFVAVMDETPVQFQYNDDLCVDKGDKSCYLEEEDVIVNILHDYEYLEVYKDEMLYMTVSTPSEKDIVLSCLPYGDYKARVCYEYNSDTGVHTPTKSNGTCMFSDFTYWKVVNTNVIADRLNGRIYFSSANAIPLFIRYCNIYGDGGSLTTNNLQLLTEEEKQQGYIDVSQDRIKTGCPFIRVIFQTDFAKVINKPVNWFE
jgi:hypothetical protein